MRLVLLACLTVLVAGCQVQPSYTVGYEVEERSGAAVGERTLAVLPFEDARPEAHYTSPQRQLLLVIPLLPYVTIEHRRFDEIVERFSNPLTPPFEEYSYPRSFAQAISRDLASTPLFSEVQFDSESTEGFDYILRGSVSATPLRRTFTAYGLSYVGGFLQGFGLPGHKLTASVAVDLELVEAASGVTVWTHALRGEVSRIANAYTLELRHEPKQRSTKFVLLIEPPDDAMVDHRSVFAWHFEALRRAMSEAMPSLSRALGSTNRPRDS